MARSPKKPGGEISSPRTENARPRATPAAIFFYIILSIHNIDQKKRFNYNMARRVYAAAKRRGVIEVQAGVRSHRTGTRRCFFFGYQVSDAFGVVRSALSSAIHYQQPRGSPNSARFKLYDIISLLVIHYNIMNNREYPVDEVNAINVTVQLLRSICKFTRQAYQAGEMIPWKTSDAQEKALNAQLKELGSYSESPHFKEYAARQLSAIINDFQDLPPEVLDKLKNKMFEFLPSNPDIKM
jgi:hypothetical protein